MTATVYILVGFFLLGLLYVAIRFSLSAYLKYLGTRIITCPESQKPAAVVVDSRHAAFTGILGDPDLRLKDCSRWPERRHCGQECLRQVERAPEDCLVRNILVNWYAGKECSICKKEFGEINWYDHKPTLLHPAAYTVEWQEIPAEKIPDALSIYKPVCWNCHIAERFRREHPDLVVDRSQPSATIPEKRGDDIHSDAA